MICGDFVNDTRENHTGSGLEYEKSCANTEVEKGGVEEDTAAWGVELRWGVG